MAVVMTPTTPSHETRAAEQREATENAGADRPLVPQQAWSEKRERQYEHIKEGLTDRGRGEDEAKEIAARTVNKERARAGEARESSTLSRSELEKAVGRH